MGASAFGDVVNRQSAALEVLQEGRHQTRERIDPPLPVESGEYSSRGIGESVTPWAASFSVRLRSNLPSVCSWLKVSIRTVPCLAWMPRAVTHNPVSVVVVRMWFRIVW